MKEIGCNVLIIGSGITGLSIAYELLKRGIEDICIIDKESVLGKHASGRNSGVLHAGIYYSPGSLKARFCVEGNRLLKEFCINNNLTIKQNGKVIVAKDEKRLDTLYELKKRADSAGALSTIIDEKELKDIEPYAYTFEKALFCPETAVFNPIEILSTLLDILISSDKVKILYSTSFVTIDGNNKIKTTNGTIKCNNIINASGSYADKIAHLFGIAKQYKILPFKGTYKNLKNAKSYLVKSNIYPVPDLDNPFLGVHFTKSIDNIVYAGPTAIPALSRENYSLIDNLDIETLPILFRDVLLTIVNKSFRSSALGEMKKYIDYYFWKEAKTLIPSISPDDLESSKKVGIRAQLVDWESKRLVMDFIVIKDGNSLHILNTISPGFTTSMSFAKYVVDQLL